MTFYFSLYSSYHTNKVMINTKWEIKYNETQYTISFKKHKTC